MRTWPNSFTKMTVETDLSGPPWKAGLPGGSVTKNLPANAGDPLRSLDQEDPPGEGNGSPLQYSWLRNPTDRGCWWAMVHGFAKSWTWLRDWRLGTPRKACVCVCVCVRMRGSKYHGLSFLAFHSKRVHRLIQRKIHLGSSQYCCWQVDVGRDGADKVMACVYGASQLWTLQLLLFT